MKSTGEGAATSMGTITQIDDRALKGAIRLRFAGTCQMLGIIKRDGTSA
jgi:hypothetical protein